MPALTIEFEAEHSGCCPEPTELTHLLEEMLEEEISEGERRTVALSHVYQCDACQQRLENLSARASEAAPWLRGRPAAMTAGVVSQVKSRGIPSLESVTPGGAAADTLDESAREVEDHRDLDFSVDLLPDGERRFCLLDILGEGGMAVVFRCRDLQSGQDLAVKVLRHRHTASDTIVDQFRSEARLQARLAHRLIAPVLETGTLTDGRPYTLMEYRPGRTLAEQMRRVDSETRSDLLDLFGQLCAVMAHAHRRRVVHRDLKPSNILVGLHGELTVIDWGLADESAERAVPGLHSSIAASLPYALDHIAGTPGYVAPEQCTGAAAEPSADVYSLGVILAEMLTGRRFPADERLPADPQSMEQAAARIVAAVRRSGASAELIRLVTRCLAIAPADRPRDAGELLVEYDRIASRLRDKRSGDGKGMDWPLSGRDVCKNPLELAFLGGRRKASMALRDQKGRPPERVICGTYSRSSRALTLAPKSCSLRERRSSVARMSAMSSSTTG